jgi:hypothetical protein
MPGTIAYLLSFSRIAKRWTPPPGQEDAELAARRTDKTVPHPHPRHIAPDARFAADDRTSQASRAISIANATLRHRVLKSREICRSPRKDVAIFNAAHN